MGVLLERKSQVIFVTASSVEEDGKTREVIVESRPQYAVVQLNGSKAKYSGRLGNDLQARQEAVRREFAHGGSIHGTAEKPASPEDGLRPIRYLLVCVFLGADFLGFIAGAGTSDVVLFAQRAATILRACALLRSELCPAGLTTV